MDSQFIKNLKEFETIADGYVSYSESQIARGDHLKNDLRLGERSWRIPETTGQFLYNLIKKINAKNTLELGTSLGYSTLWIAQALSENDADFKLITIERNTPKFNVMQKLFSTVPYAKNISFFNAEIIDVLHNITDQTFDFIFMDADRGNYELYWSLIKNFLHKESLVVIDNAFMEKQSMHAFMEKLSADNSIVTHLHPIDHGLLLVTLADSNYNPENLISDIL